MGSRGLIVAAVLGMLVAGCGSDEFPPAAEPADSPPLARPPAGHTYPIGIEPEGLVFDTRTGIAAAVTRDPSALTQFDVERGRVTASDPLPATARHLALAAPGGPVLIPVEQSDELVEQPLPSGKPRSAPVGDHPHDAVAAGGRVFVGDEFSDQMTVLDGLRTEATVPTPAQPGGLAAANGYVLVVAVAERVLAVYDAKTLEQVAQLDAGTGPTHVVAAGDRAWVADTQGDAVLTYALGSRPRELTRTGLGGSPYGVAVDARRERLWVTLTDRNEAVVFDVGGPRPVELRRYPTVRQPNSIAIDERDGSALIAGRADGRLERIAGPRR